MDKKELIREAAIKIISIEGYHNTSIKMIAEEAKVSVGTIYNYFTNKSEILDYIFEVELRKKIYLLRSINNQDISLRDKLLKFLEEHFNDLKENPQKAIVLVQESRIPRKHKLNSINSFMNDIPMFLSQMVEKSIKNEDIRIVNSKIIGDVIFYSVREISLKFAYDPSYNLSLVKEEIISMFWDGLREKN